MKKRDANQMDLFTMTTPESPASPIQLSQHAPDTVALSSSAETSAAGNRAITPSPFRGEGWGEGPSNSLIPAEPEDDFALFDSDPFFNPAVATQQPAPANTTPPPSAEERLLEDIIQKKTSDAEVASNIPQTSEQDAQLSRELQAAVTPLTQAESELNKTRQVAESLRLRCATLETERDAARRDVEKERQLRTEAIRNRTPATFKPVPQELQTRRQNLPGLFISKRALFYALPGILVLCFLAYSLGHRQSAGSVTIMDPSDTPAAMESPPLPVVPPPVSMREQPAAVAWPSFGDAGYRVTGDNTTRRVVFNYGVFTRGTLLSETAQRNLVKIAAAFKPDIASFRIEVVGHTDSTPVRSSNAFADNHDLAMARATAAAEFLTGKCGLPTAAVSAIAADNTTPPHPGTTPDIQKKNRTVVLNITHRF